MVEPRIVIPAVVGSSPISHPIKKFCSVRLSVEDTALSRREEGFDSPTEYQVYQGVLQMSCVT
jgi:hypothetical protein